MEFGKVEVSELDAVDHSLPKDSARTKRILAAQKAKTKGKVHFGCAKWGRKEWVNLIYPKGTKEKDFLEAYAKHFDCIELNASHYKIYPPEQMAEWASKVGKNFLFCPKFYNGISHMRRLKNCEELTSAFLRSVEGFGDHLGPCFLQLRENFDTRNFDTIEAYIKSLPRDLQLFVEVRHPDWFIPANQKLLGDLLEAYKVGSVITDTSGRRDMLHMELTTPKAFIRFVGNNLHPTDYPRIDDWVERISKWLDGGIREVYFMMHQHDESNTPIISVDTVKKLNAACDLKLTVPQLIAQQENLL